MQISEAKQEELQFKFIQGQYMVLPYHPRAGVYKADTLLQLYNRLQKEELWDIVFHENPEMTLLEFVNFFNSTDNLLQICSIVHDEQFVDIAGMAWLSNITTCSGVLTRAQGSFVFFRDWQKPQHTDVFARILLDYWFEILKIDVVIGITPSKNRASLIFTKRNGFQSAGYLENFTSYGNQPDDAAIVILHRDKFLKHQGGKNG